MLFAGRTTFPTATGLSMGHLIDQPQARSLENPKAFSGNPAGSAAHLQVARSPAEPLAPQRRLRAAEMQQKCGVAQSGRPADYIGRQHTRHRRPPPPRCPRAPLSKALPKRAARDDAEESRPCTGAGEPSLWLRDNRLSGPSGSWKPAHNRFFSFRRGLGKAEEEASAGCENGLFPIARWAGRDSLEMRRCRSKRVKPSC